MPIGIVDKKTFFIILFFMPSIALIPTIAGNEENITEDSVPDLDTYTPTMAGTSDPSDEEPGENPVPSMAERMNFAKEMSRYVLAFGLVLSLFTGIIALYTKGWNRDATNVFTVTIIITAGLFLMTAGYSSEQIAPMYGLLGTIVGYLLGKTRSSGDENK
jgi:hypothetical protein